MNREICTNCKNYFMWEDLVVLPDGNGLFSKKTMVNEVCCKVNRDINKINKCNSYEEYEIGVTEKKIEGKNEEIKNELVRVYEDGKKEIIEKENKKENKKKKSKFVK